MRKLILIGGGGHCKSVLDSALAMNEFAFITIGSNTIIGANSTVLADVEDNAKYYGIVANTRAQCT